MRSATRAAARTAKPPVCSVSERADIESGLSVDAGGLAFTDAVVQGDSGE